MIFERGQRLKLPHSNELMSVDHAVEMPTGWRLYLEADDGTIQRVELTSEDAKQAEVFSENGMAESADLLAGLWAEWMKAASSSASGTVLATTPLRPYAHQNNAVYGAMLPQPRLRFLLADEPGTGKTIMAGMYIREMQRLGLVHRALIVAPAHLVSKWQLDFERFFNGGLRRIQATTIQEGALSAPHNLWIVSLDLAAVNPAVQEAIRPDLAGWDLVVIDEAHRLTPTAQAYYGLGELLSRHTPRLLLMTATPHRGKEWLFRSLLHLVDPDVFPPCSPNENDVRQIRPGAVHFLRRMKEDLLDYDNVSPLFKGRKAHNVPVALNSVEAAAYAQALRLVDRYFPPNSAPLARMVYGKRAASSLFALAQTLRRRKNMMGSAIPAAAALQEDPYSEDPAAQEEARVVVEQSKSAKAERQEIATLLQHLDSLLANPNMPVSKWPRMLDACLQPDGIVPGGDEQAVIFTEYADTADWLVSRFNASGFRAERYSGRDPEAEREQIRSRFASRKFRVLVSTDAGNEGIDLQSACLLVNWDIPWSLVRLEQRMGRIHRVGQTRDVSLYNLIATDTREGDVLNVLLDNFIVAADRLSGKIFDSLSLVAEVLGLEFDQLLSAAFDDQRASIALRVAHSINANRIEAAARQVSDEENSIKSAVDVAAAIAASHRETLERINPSIVEAFLHRLSKSSKFSLTPHAAGNGIFIIERTDGARLPKEIANSSRAVVASSNESVRNANESGADVQGVTVLGPSQPPFFSLVADISTCFASAFFQGAPLIDQTSATGYLLFAYEADVSEAGGKRRSVWPCVIRVDATGARQVRWELLANLEAGSSTTAQRLHPADLSAAEEEIERVVRREEARRARLMEDWLHYARRELERLPAALSSDIPDSEARRTERKRIEAAVTNRLCELKGMASVQLSRIRRVGWAHVQAALKESDPTTADSEIIAMRFVATLLREDGWMVSDVHTEDRGYDLYASRGRTQRCIEVKGVWKSASNSGVELTGHELLMAKQLASDYWLHVVENCADGTGRLFAAFPNPAKSFENYLRDASIVRIPGSALRVVREEMTQ